MVLAFWVVMVGFSEFCGVVWFVSVEIFEMNFVCSFCGEFFIVHSLFSIFLIALDWGGFFFKKSILDVYFNPFSSFCPPPFLNLL